MMDDTRRAVREVLRRETDPDVRRYLGKMLRAAAGPRRRRRRKRARKRPAV